jgi:hypothetical protein
VYVQQFAMPAVGHGGGDKGRSCDSRHRLRERLEEGL